MPENISPEGKRLLVVDDEQHIVDFLTLGFTYEGFSVRNCMDGQAALRICREWIPQIVILDIMLPLVDGLSVCRQLRARDTGVYIIMLTAKDEVDDRVTGLETGADDYLTKPFAFKELLARVRAGLRRRGDTSEDILRSGDLTLNRSTREIKLNDQEINLTVREFDLLEALMSHPRQVLSREALLNYVWGYEYAGDTGVVEVYIRYLREKLNDLPPKIIQTVRGVGYTLRG